MWERGAFNLKRAAARSTSADCAKRAEKKGITQHSGFLGSALSYRWTSHHLILLHRLTVVVD